MGKLELDYQHARDRASQDAGPGHDDVDFLHGHSIPQTSAARNGQHGKSEIPRVDDPMAEIGEYDVTEQGSFIPKKDLPLWTT